MQSRLRKYLAQQLTKVLGVNLKAGLEVTYKNTTPFTGKVIIREKGLAKEDALKEYSKDLILFTDSAKDKEFTAAEVA